MKKLFALLLCMALMLCCAAFAEGEYLYIEGSDGLYICGYTGNDPVLRLPAELDGMKVAGVSKGAFCGNSTITEVHIPDGYITIEESAFDGCISLRDVFIGATIKNIGARAFANCKSLLGLSIATRDYSAHATAFEGSNERAIALLDREALWSDWNGEDFDALYIAGVELMSRGEYEKARDVFLSLYGYELSADYYFYSAARVYESRGEIDKAVAIYALMPDLNDCATRLAYYGGAAEVGAFFIEGDDYLENYNELFGDGGMFAGMLGEKPAENAPNVYDYMPTEAPEETAAPEATPAPEVTPVDTPEPESPAATSEPEVTEEPVGCQLSTGEAQPEVSSEPAVIPGAAEGKLVTYHDYSGEMPYEYDDYSDSEGYFAMYYFYDDIQKVLDYVALFEEAGWVTYSESINGWQHVYISTPDQSCYFYLSYSETEGLMILMYESGMDYGFDPAAGL